MNLCTAGNALKCVVFPKIGKTNILVGDETKQMLLFIFHTLYMSDSSIFTWREKRNSGGSDVSTI